MADYRAELLDLYNLFPFHEHPLWRSIREGVLTLEQVLDAETQHCLRTKAGQSLRREALDMAEAISPCIFEQLLETFLEECTHDASGPSHLDLIKRLVMTGGRTEQEIFATLPTPGNAAAMAMYREITRRGAGCHMLGAGAVEHFYCRLSPTIYDAYTRIYNMSPEQAETYRLHGPMDEEHAERAFAVLDEGVRLHGWDSVRLSVRDAFVATSLHYDGMLQAATGKLEYWNGRTL
jgi:pyrroloquinoline quinone (PQQ) biosynthesis protein C